MSDKTSKMVILKTYDMSHLAHLDRAKLADEGIQSFIKDENIVTISPYLANAVGAIKLMVFENDVVKAREVLALNEFKSLASVAEGEIEEPMSCSACGSTEVIQLKSIWRSVLLSLFFFVPVPVRAKQYYCIKCEHKWKSD